MLDKNIIIAIITLIIIYYIYKDTMSCNGPCLPHCYKNNYNLFMIGMFAGIFTQYLLENCLHPKKENKKL